MTEVTEQILNEMTRIIVEQTDAEQIVLFGSRARGQTKPYSDVDLLIVERQPFDKGRSRRRETTRIREALSKFRLPIDVAAFSRNEIDYWRDSPNHIISRALREGKVLYARP